jgi:hypothetical protein
MRRRKRRSKNALHGFPRHSKTNVELYNAAIAKVLFVLLVLACLVIFLW